MTKNQFSRRDFFKLGAVGAAGAAAAGLAGCAPAADKAAAGSDAAGAADASAEGAVSTNDVVIKLGDTLPKWSFMVPPAPIPEDEITETIENDIIVVGAGMSGLTTAVAAAEQGGKVTLFSASSAPISRGGSNFARNSKVMEELKVEPFAPSPFYYHEMRAASFAVDQAKWMKGYNNSEEAMNWMIDIANEAGLQVILERDNNFDLGPHYAHAFSTLGDSSMVSTGQQGAVEALEKKALEYGVQIIYDMKAEQLIREGDNAGRVTGVVASHTDGTEGYTLFNGTYIVLATGDYSTDKEMLACYCPEALQYVGFEQTETDYTLPPKTAEEMIAIWDAGVEEGAYWKADTLDELADQLGLDAAKLKDVVARYNELCKKGVDEDFYKDPTYLVEIEETGPYYAAKNTCTFMTIMGGLRTSVNMEVCDENDEPIPGLFNVGCMVGDMYANEYNFAIPGNSYGINCLTFGYMLGHDLAAGKFE